MMRYVKIISLLALGLTLLTSCAAQRDEQEIGTSDMSIEIQSLVPSESLMTESTPFSEDVQNDIWETKKIGENMTVYVSDYETYGVVLASAYYFLRNNGDSDPYHDLVVYENGTDIQLESLKNVYSVSSDLEWGIRCSYAADDLMYDHFHPYLNVEKWENDAWTRCAVLNADRAIGGKTVSAKAFYNDTLIKNLSKKKMIVSPSEIFPAVAPGQYRFVFYITIEQDGKTENRMYYIPFEVVA